MKCRVVFSAEDEMSGIIDITQEEYEVISYALNPNNWDNVTGSSRYCGGASIEIVDDDEEE